MSELPPFDPVSSPPRLSDLAKASWECIQAQDVPGVFRCVQACTDSQLRAIRQEWITQTVDDWGVQDWWKRVCLARLSPLMWAVEASDVKALRESRHALDPPLTSWETLKLLTLAHNPDDSDAPSASDDVRLALWETLGSDDARERVTALNFCPTPAEDEAVARVWGNWPATSQCLVAGTLVHHWAAHDQWDLTDGWHQRRLQAIARLDAPAPVGAFLDPEHELLLRARESGQQELQQWIETRWAVTPESLALAMASRPRYHSRLDRWPHPEDFSVGFRQDLVNRAAECSTETAPLPRLLASLRQEQTSSPPLPRRARLRS